MDVKLGEFRLRGLLGRGGMGEVWRAKHLPTGADAAVKVVTAELARRDHFHAAFRMEVQAMARLQHPGVVLVFDYGRVRATEATAQFEIDAPYLAMELCRCSLSAVAERINSWDAARAALEQVTAALAHAHARGVIHRDIKPHNVLVANDEGAERYKLADFGLARPLDDAQQRSSGSGTPNYMAPEQIIGAHHDQGPWTDLYGLGCLATWLLTGRAPFESDDAEEVFRGHLFETPPALIPRFAVPSGVSKWIELLLVKDPTRRISSAADAKHLLSRVGEASSMFGSSASPSQPTLRESSPTVVLDERQQGERQRFEEQHRDSRFRRTSYAAPHKPHWRRPTTARPRNVGAGIALHGLRPVPLVGRDVERDAIWADLGRVASRRTPHLVVLRGQTGVGKSRLARWVSEHAEELGAARVGRIDHSRLSHGAEGLGRMIARMARAGGADRPTTLRAMERVMSVDGVGREFDLVDVLALTDLALGGARWSSRATSRERRDLLIRFAQAVAWERPWLLWIDDAQWAADTMEWVQALIQSNVPVLVLVTVRDDSLVDRPVEAQQLQTLIGLAEPYCREIQLPPLSGHEHRALIDCILPFSPVTASTLAARTEGNPLFAVQLVNDWLERGLLRPSPAGFEVASDTEHLCESIHELWSDRVERVVGRYLTRSTLGFSPTPADVERALWAAAVLGQEVSWDQWTAVCDQVDAEASTRLIEELVRLQLAEHTTSGFRFAHGLLAESLRQRAADAGEAEKLHRAAGEMLAARGGVDPARVADHLLAAGALEEALEPLLSAADAATRRGDFMLALELDERRDKTLDELGVGPVSAERVRGWARRVRTHLLRGDEAQVDELMGLSLRGAGELGDARASADVLWTELLRARHKNETSRGIELGHEALSVYEELGDEHACGRVHNKLGELRRRLGELDASIGHYRRAREIFMQLDDPFELAWSMIGLGTSQRHAGAYDVARSNITEALRLFSGLGSRLGLGNAHNELGELERTVGRLEKAEQHYLRVSEYWATQRHAELVLVRYNLAMTLLAREAWDEVAEVIAEVRDTAANAGHQLLLLLTAASLACCAAASGRWAEAERLFGEFEDGYDELDVVEPDIAELSWVLATLCREERPRLALRSVTVARSVYGCLNDGRERDCAALVQELS